MNIFCKYCKLEKEPSAFYPSRLKKKEFQCKECTAIYNKQYRQNNKEQIYIQKKLWAYKNKDRLLKEAAVYRENNKDKIQSTRKIYYQNNKEKVKEKVKIYSNQNKEKISEYFKKIRVENKEFFANKSKKFYEQNKEAILEKNKIYRAGNKEKLSKQNKNYREKNLDRIREKHTIWQKEKRANDPLFKLRGQLSRSICHALKNRFSSKAGESMLKFLPYSVEELKNHLELLFSHPDNLTPDGKVWMNWENRGLYISKTWNNNDPSTWVWQLDHIIPQAEFIFTSMTDESFQKCWALENLRPLKADINLMDGLKTRHKKQR